MDADYDIHEIVKVIRDGWLLDAESYQRSYCTSHGNDLAPGYYVVTWPENVHERRFNEQAAFHGPFAMRKNAKIFLDAMNKHNYVLILPARKFASPVGTLQVEKKVA